jgi:hypothetical protein
LKKLGITLCAILLFGLPLQAQYGSLELNSGGFSFIPLFTSNKPHIILRAGTDDKKRWSLNLINLIMMDGMSPANYSLITRYRLIDKKIKLNIGFQMPGYRIFENEDLRSRSVQEVRLYYPINKKTNLLFFYMHGEGKNFEMNNNFYSLYYMKTIGNWRTSTQGYLLFSSLSATNPSSGLAQTVSYLLDKKIKLNLFVNKSFTSDTFNKTVGLEFSF